MKTWKLDLETGFGNRIWKPNPYYPLLIMTLLTQPKTEQLQDLSTLELAQALAERLVITSDDWHRLKANRPAQAKQDLAAALVFLLKEQPQEALNHVQQAQGWLDRSISAPPCPDHGK